MLCLRVLSASGSRFNFGSKIALEWLIFLVFACFRELASGLSLPEELPKLLDHTTAPPPPLIFPGEPSSDANFRAVNDLVSPRKGAYSPPIISPLAEILRSRDSEAQLNGTLSHLAILARLTNLTSVADSRRQNYTVDRSRGPVSSTEAPESVTPELSAKIKASLDKEEDDLIVEPTKSAAGFVVVVVVVSVMAYVALFVWRKLLEQRYGNREMLIDEDEFCHASNLYDFHISSDREMT